MGNYFETQWMLFITQFMLLPAILLALYAQTKVSSTFKKFSTVANARGLTGAEVARSILAYNNVNDVQVVATRGNLTDNYNPRTKTVNLSESVYSSRSIAALSVAAHEVGHAMQHNKGYLPLHMRSFIFPVVAFASKLAMPLVLLGLFFSSTNGVVLQLGILFFAFTVLFQIVTLPVEFNASKRAIRELESYKFLDGNEIEPAKKVLNAAALTYVAAAITAIVQLLRLLVISRARD